MKARCYANGCNAPGRTKGLCGLHYMRKRRTGDPNTPYIRNRRGTGGLHSRGYRRIYDRLEHVVIVERILGKSLPPDAEVHHVNGMRADNRHANLVVCPNHAYHMLLHRRAKALDACGHPDWPKCVLCKKYDSPANLSGSKQRYHLTCMRQKKAASALP